MLSVSYVPFVPPPSTNPHHPLMLWGRRNDLPTISAIAERLGVSQPRLSQIINRKHRPTPELALRIIEQTGIDYRALVELTGAEKRAGVVATWKRKRRKRPL